jgi:hypothetical protein
MSPFRVAHLLSLQGRTCQAWAGVAFVTTERLRSDGCGTSAALPPHRMTPQLAPDGAAMRAWLEAQGAFAADLAAFQSTNPTTASYDMADVLAAIAPAQQLGFAYSVRWVSDQIEVRLMHRSGWDLISIDGGNAWEALADLLGVPLAPAAHVAAAQPEPAPAPAPAPTPAKAKVLPVAVAVVPEPAPTPAAEPDEFADADLMGEGTPDTPVLPEDREPLNEADRETCLAMIRAITPEQRKAFTIAFRSHFNVDKSSRTIAPHIVQVQHQKFIQSYIDELELCEVAA